MQIIENGFRLGMGFFVSYLGYGKGGETLEKVI